MADIKNTNMEILEFCVGDITYGVDIGIVTEIFVARDIKSMPNSGDYVEGIFMFRGTPTPVVNMIKLFNCTIGDGDRTMFVVCGVGGKPVAYHVSAVRGILAANTDGLQPMEKIFKYNSSSYVEAILNCDDKVILMLNFEKIAQQFNIVNDADTDTLDSVDETASTSSELAAENAIDGGVLQ